MNPFEPSEIAEQRMTNAERRRREVRDYWITAAVLHGAWIVPVTIGYLHTFGRLYWF